MTTPTPWQPISSDELSDAGYDPMAHARHQAKLREQVARAALQPEQVAWNRAETDPCERGTVGCSVLHTRDSECETW